MILDGENMGDIFELEWKSKIEDLEVIISIYLFMLMISIYMLYLLFYNYSLNLKNLSRRIIIYYTLTFRN